jgi:uncharacterized protein (TIGR03435 family)
MGGPAWADRWELWDITAKAPAGSAAAKFIPLAGAEHSFPFPNLPGGPELLAMMKTLLADRFALKTHREVRQLSVLALKAGKSPPVLEAAHDPSTGRRANGGKDQNEWRNFSMAELASWLETNYARPVLDRTGIGGSYDFLLSYDNRISDDADGFDFPADVTGRSLKSALKSQVGLVLEEVKAPIEVLVIDSATRPGAN